MDPLHPHTLLSLVIFMSKNKHCVESARTYMRMDRVESTLEFVDMKQEGMLACCEQLLSSMGDWLTLFSYLETVKTVCCKTVKFRTTGKAHANVVFADEMKHRDPGFVQFV